MAMEEKTSRQYISQALCYLVPITLHLIGLYLLHATRWAHSNKIQRLYLVNLSIAEIVRGVLKFLYPMILIWTGDSRNGAAFYLWMIQTSGGFLWYILVMVQLTVDRFLEVYLNLRYQIYCTEERTKIGLIVSAALSTIIAIIMCCRLDVDDFDVTHYILSLYFWPATEITFLLVASFTYTYLFIKIRANRQKVKRLLQQFPRERTPTQAELNRGRNLQKIKKHFYLPSFLILSFILFWIVPDMTEFFLMLCNKPVPSMTSLYVNISYSLAMTIDALIYVFASAPVRNHLVKQLSKTCRWMNQ